MPFVATRMGLEIAMLGEGNHTEKEKYHIFLIDIPYMCNLKRNDTNELIYKTETQSQI